MDNTCVTIAKECSLNPHGHETLIRKVAKECHNALILLRSANKSNERNLIPIGLRKALIEDAMGHEGGVNWARRGHGGA